MTEKQILIKYQNQKNRDNKLRKKFERIIIEKDILPWITTKDELCEIESEAKCIWIITPDFWWEINDKEIELMVIKNIKKGKEYKYLFPQSKVGIANELERKFNPIKKSDNVEFIQVDNNIFDLIIFELVLYDPLNPQSKYHEGFYIDILNSRYDHSNSKAGINVKMDKSLYLFIEFFKYMLEKKHGN